MNSNTPRFEMKLDYLRLCSRASDNPGFIWFCDFPSIAGRLLCDELGEHAHHVLMKATAQCISTLAIDETSLPALSFARERNSEVKIRLGKILERHKSCWSNSRTWKPPITKKTLSKPRRFFHPSPLLILYKEILGREPEPPQIIENTWC